MSERIQTLMRKVKAGLEEVYALRLRGVYLYGSYARGEEDGESDVDVLVILDQVASYESEIDRTSDLMARLSLEYNVSLSRVFVAEPEWQVGDGFFVANARAEAVAA